MSILVVLGVLAVVAVIAAIRAVVIDGYHRTPRRSPLRQSAYEESTWSWR